MPRFEDGSYGSAKGIALIAKVLAGKCSMHYTCGRGQRDYPGGHDPEDHGRTCGV